MKIEGTTKFYDGWLHNVLGMPQDISKDPDWQRGWEIADETGPEAGEVLAEEIGNGHILVSED